LKPIDPLEHGLLNPVTLEEFFSISFFDKITVNMASSSEVEEEMEKEDDK